MRSTCTGVKGGSAEVTQSSESSGGGEAVSGQDTSVDADSRQNGRKPRKRRSKSNGAISSKELGVMHVCDFTECKLPPEDWYLASKNRRT